MHGADLEKIEPSGLGLELSAGELQRAEIASLLVSLRYPLIPGTLLGCLTVAFVIGRMRA